MKKFRRLVLTTLTLFLYVLTFSAQSSIEFIGQVQKFQDSVKLKRGQNYDFIDSATFDFNQCMKMFTKLKLDSNLQYGFKYFDNFLDGKPYIYVTNHSFDLDKYLQDETEKALKNSSRTIIHKEKKIVFIHPKPFQFLNDSTFQKPEKEIIEYNQEEYEGYIQNKLFKFLNDSINRAYNNIEPEDSEEGYLQYLFFREKGELFALKWHANYSEKYIVTSKDQIKKIEIKYTHNVMFDTDKKALKKLRNIDPTPLIKLDSKKCEITWFEIETHNGIYERTYRISRSLPHRIEIAIEKNIVDINPMFVY